MPPENLKKGEVRIIEMHLTLDPEGKVHIPPQLMDALGIGPGDMLSFHFDDAGVHVKGGKKPPYVHAYTTPPARGSHRSTGEQPRAEPVSSGDFTQMNLFGEAAPPPPPQSRRRNAR